MNELAHNDRLSAAIAHASCRLPVIEEERRRHLFTTESAKVANEAKAAKHDPKPQSATIRVEADVVALLRELPQNERVAIVSRIIREGLAAAKK